MEDDQKVSHVQNQLLFGKLTDTPTIERVPVLDINNQILKISVNSFEITIKELTKFYKINSSCNHKLKGQPNFRIAQGRQLGKITLQNELLSSFGFNWKQICFKIVDSAEQANKSKIEIEEKQEELSKTSKLKVQLTLRLLEKQQPYHIKISLSQKVIDLKKRAIETIPQLKSQTPDLLKLIFQGTPMLNQKELLCNHKLQNGSIILIKVQRNVGCFCNKSLVVMADKTTKQISEIKTNDKILSYNEKTRLYESDTVTFIQKCYLQQQITIVMQDETIICTTPNHNFLCSDGQFRCFTAELQNKGAKTSLKQGDSLKSITNKDVKIKQIFGGRVESQNRQFYHLSIQNNHNFIIDKFITHNMTINLKFPKDQTIIAIDASPSQSVKSIKQKIEDLSHTQIHCQKLIFAGKELNNYKTLSEQNVFKQSTLHIVYKKPQLFNLVNEGTLILTPKGSKVRVQDLKIGDEVSTIDTQRGKLSKGDRIQQIQKIELEQYFSLGISERENLIYLAADSYVQLQTGQAISVRDICYENGQKAVLRKYNNTPAEVLGMAHYNKQTFKKHFYQIFLVNSKNFIANDIIIHNLVINIVLIKNDKKVNRFCYGISPSDSIASVKEKINLTTNIPVEMITLSFLNYENLEDSKTIQQYKINTQHVVFAYTSEPSSKFGLCYTESEQSKFSQKQQKTLEIQISQTQKQVINYNNNKQKTVEQIINQILPNYNSSYFFIFSDIIMYPQDKLKKIQQAGNAFESFSQNTVILLKNQKVNFIKQMNIKKEEVGNISSIEVNNLSKLPSMTKMQSISVGISSISNWLPSLDIQKASKRIQKDSQIKQGQYKERDFYISFLQYTSRKYTQKINAYITNLQKYNENQNDNIKRTFNIIKDLYINMQLLKNYYNKCYLGVKNFKFSHYFKKHNTFYLHGFTLAFKQSQKVKQELNGHRGTLFHISSINGKQIQRYSLYPNEQEILFAPFTYFLVLQIIPNENFDQVYLVELSSPITFQKNIILWVDDWPVNNVKEIAKILGQLDIQILQLKSTLEAQKWIKEFGWLVTWKGLQFKIIEDMSRYEGAEIQGFKRQQNLTAGIDLLKVLYEKHKFNVKTMIYCKNRAGAQEAVKKARIESSKFIINTFESQLLKFCNIGKQK